MLAAVLATGVVALLQHALPKALVLSRRHRRLEHRGALQRGDRVLKRSLLRRSRVLALVQVRLDERAPRLDGRKVRNDGLVVASGGVLVLSRLHEALLVVRQVQLVRRDVLLEVALLAAERVHVRLEVADGGVLISLEVGLLLLRLAQDELEHANRLTTST